jgi:hypothetical protein
MQPAVILGKPSTSQANWIDALAQTQFTDHMRLISASVHRKRPAKSP